VYEDWWKTISSEPQSYPPYVLGIAPETILFSHDWIGQDMTPWNQSAIKNASQGSRTSAIRFDRTGTYRFELRRWPREDGSAIQSQDSSNQGKALTNVVRAQLTIDGAGQWTRPVEAGDTSAIFDVKIQAGKQTTLMSAFLDGQDHVVSGAYYIYVTKR
jgi:hypothetical protein